MHDDNRAKWVPWSKLTKQQQEITADKSDPTFVVEQGILKQKASFKEVEIVLSSDLLVYFAVQWRGLALDEAGLCCHLVYS
eukprot:1701019-Amphidinium_carterae.1